MNIQNILIKYVKEQMNNNLANKNFNTKDLFLKYKDKKLKTSNIINTNDFKYQDENKNNNLSLNLQIEEFLAIKYHLISAKLYLQSILQTNISNEYTNYLKYIEFSNVDTNDFQKFHNISKKIDSEGFNYIQYTNLAEINYDAHVITNLDMWNILNNKNKYNEVTYNEQKKCYTIPINEIADLLYIYGQLNNQNEKIIKNYDILIHNLSQLNQKMPDKFYITNINYLSFMTLENLYIDNESVPLQFLDLEDPSDENNIMLKSKVITKNNQILNILIKNSKTRLGK